MFSIKVNGFARRVPIWMALCGMVLTASLTGCPNAGGRFQVEFINATGLTGTSLQVVRVGSGVVSEQPNLLTGVSYTNGSVFKVQDLQPGTYQFLLLFNLGQTVVVSSFQLEVRRDLTVSLIFVENEVVQVLDPFLNKDLEPDLDEPLLLVD